MASIYVTFAAIIAFDVVYNSNTLRIAITESPSPGIFSSTDVTMQIPCGVHSQVSEKDALRAANTNPLSA